MPSVFTGSGGNLTSSPPEPAFFLGPARKFPKFCLAQVLACAGFGLSLTLILGLSACLNPFTNSSNNNDDNGTPTPTSAGSVVSIPGTPVGFGATVTGGADATAANTYVFTQGAQLQAFMVARAKSVNQPPTTNHYLLKRLF